MISNNFSGINDNNKPSSKVLRPPGGGSSDIFGADMPSTPRNVKNHMQSNIFSCEKNSSAVKNNGGEPRRAQKALDSYTRLFGEPERPFTPARNHMKSNIPFGGNSKDATDAAASAAAPIMANGNGHHHVASTNGKSNSSVSSTSTSSSVSSSTENLKMNGVSKTDGNPVTGEGYKPSDMISSIPSLNGANQVINKNRIPPGGFSSGLW